ncbi:uncharacterized protein EV420DRAFT_1552868 [Desarmillaria tabescens]|uniref:Uncharacterized protein n=1 Tax=Armillaria tabescens TaxID=1929756 RepID=A0AA39K6Z9_ARMTA|nr:uncharacterized protein EV420DRAFT_1552868 [Desarmillaria tabescens]KAK0455722.1 hypothetical protein EV420DRAFT_1552868 [Desarmillaria tabescens]
MEQQRIPFPRSRAASEVTPPRNVDESVINETFHSAVEPNEGESNIKPSETNSSTTDSFATSYSKLTLSDKLSALPPPGSPNLNRTRSPNPSASRGFRRSFEASGSLPSVRSTGDIDLIQSAWNSPRQSSHLVTRSNASDGSVGLDTPRNRASLDSDRISLPAFHSVRNAFSRRNRGSDPTLPAQRTEQLRGETVGSRSRSPSRAASPLRLLQQWSQGLHRSHNHPTEEPFIPVDPFRAKSHFRFPGIPCFCVSEPSDDPDAGRDHDCDQIKQRAESISAFVTETLPRVFYLYSLLRLPALYFSRVARIFEDAEVSRPDVQRMIDACSRPGYTIPLSSHVNVNSNAYRTSAAGVSGHVGAAALVADLDILPEDWAAPFVSPALVRFKHSWEAFIDTLMREWKTLNVVSALLLTAILTMFQIPNAASDPITRTAALLSLICALMSVSYGCMYIVRFGTMRTMYRASRWAEEARKTNTVIWWNVWVMLAMPAVWLSWSMVYFVISILSFVWRTGSYVDPDEREGLSPTGALGPRIAITGVFLIGMVYLVLIIKTLKSYGTHWVLKSGGQVPEQEEERRGRERVRGTSSQASRRRSERYDHVPEATARETPDLRKDKVVEEVTETEVKENGRLRTLLGFGVSRNSDLEKGMRAEKDSLRRAHSSG